MNNRRRMQIRANRYTDPSLRKARETAILINTIPSIKRFFEQLKEDIIAGYKEGSKMQISNERGYWRGWCPAWHTWLFGNLVYLDGVPYIVADKKVDEDSRVVEVRRPPSSSNPGNLFTEEVGSLYVEAQQVSVESVGEFTGFYDKQGWPIFEDDYLESPGSDRAYHYIATYDHESHYIYGTPTADSFFSRNLDELSEEAVVCGNDYEHEFLGKKYPWEGE